MTEIIVVVVCLVLNAVFAAVEMAFVAVGKPELRQRAKRGDPRAKSLLDMRENPERALSVIQIGISLVGAVSAAVSGAGAEETLSPFFENYFGVSEEWAEAFAIASVVLPLTYVSVVLGELVPKSIALKYPNRVLNFGAFVLKLGISLFGPIVSLLEKSTKFVMKVFFPKVVVPEVPDAENSSQVDLSELSNVHRQYIFNLAQIEKKRIKDILLPWKNVDWISNGAAFEEVVLKVVKCGHTRIPVLDSNDRVVGILHSKEFLAYASGGNHDWHSILRETVNVRHSDDLLGTLRRLQESKKHMGIVFEGSHLIGVVTIEDILEEIIGDIFDEDDDGLVKKLLANRIATARPN